MSDLRALAAKLGLDDTRTLLQSGNLVFEASDNTPSQLEKMLEDATKKRLGLETSFFVRTAKEWEAIVAANPFRAEAARDPGHLVVLLLKTAPDRQHAKALDQAIPGREQAIVKGRHAYITYPDGIGRSRLTHVLIERKLGTPGTGRNWNTVLKLGAMAAANR